MKKFIIIICICVLTIFSISCNQKTSIEDTNIISSLQTSINTLTTKYFNKYENKRLTTIDNKEIKQDLYVKVAEKLPTAFSVSFGNITYNEKQKVKFNIGNNSYIFAEAFYLKKKELFVFLPLLALEGATTNKLLFCVDGMYFSSKIYEGEVKKLEITDAFALSTLENTINTIETKINNADRDVITQTTQNHDNSLGINLRVNNSLLPLNTILFIRKSYQKFSEPTEYLIDIVKSNDYSLEIKSTTNKGMVTKEEKIYTDLTVSVVGGGTLGFDLWNDNKK